MVLEYCNGQSHTAGEILAYLGVTYQSKNIQRYIVALLEHGQLAIEDSTKKRNVRYIAINK